MKKKDGGRKIKQHPGTGLPLLKSIKLFPRDHTVGESLQERENTRLGIARTSSALRKSSLDLNTYLLEIMKY